MNSSAQPDQECELHCNLKILRDVSLFADMAPEMLQVMAYLCERRSFPAGQYILAQGDLAEGPVIIVEGSAHIELDGQLVAVIKSGLCVGGMAMLGDFRWLYSLTALEETECLLLPRRKFLPQLIAQPNALAAYGREMVEAIVGWDKRQLEVADEVRWNGLGML